MHAIPGVLSNWIDYYLCIIVVKLLFRMQIVLNLYFYVAYKELFTIYNNIILK